MRDRRENNKFFQCESKINLVQQKQSLEEYLSHAGSKQTLVSYRNNDVQKLVQITEALKHKGELDPAFRRNKKYREGGIGNL